MANMNQETRQRIVEVAHACGFTVGLKSDGADLYAKNLVFRSKSYPSTVYGHRNTGIDVASGKLGYLKVAVHPHHFRPELTSADDGIEEYFNRKTGVNLLSSSNYVDFPRYENNGEPCGKCYKVLGFESLRRLLEGLQRSA